MLLSFRMWLGKKLFGIVGYGIYPTGIRISPGRMVKWMCQKPELEGHRYAAAHTTIPIPKIYRAHTLHGKLAIEMQFLQGCETLQVCWGRLSDSQKRTIVEQVAAFMKQLRGLQCPEKQKISSANGGPFRDTRLGSKQLFGPFDNVAAFHECVRCGIPQENGREAFGEKVMQIHERDYKLCFTHGDLGVQNVLIRNGSVAAIIDWENAGWFPEYWEYTKAHYNRVLLPEFYEMLAQGIDRYDDEFEAERELWKILDQPYDEDGMH